MQFSNNKWDHCLSLFRITISEIFLISPVLFKGPVEHLCERNKSKEICSKTLAWNRECQPAKGLPEIVSAWNKAKSPSLWNTSLWRSWFPKISKCNMAHKIHELKATESNEEANLDCIIWPCGWCVLRMNQEVHCSNTEQYPIMSTVLKHVEKWHGIIREPVHEKCFQLSLYVMQEKHSDTNFLREGIRCVFPINLLTE